MSTQERSVTHAAIPGGQRINGVAVSALVAGSLILVGRPLFEQRPHGPTLLLLAYSALMAVSLAPSLKGGGSVPLSPTVVVAIGIAAVLLAARITQQPIPLVLSAWALPLNLVAAVAEEAFFRRLLYGTLRPWGVVAAVVGSALAFAMLHVPFYGPAVFWVDLGAGLLFGWQRWASGGWVAPALTHGAANVLAALR